MIDYVCKEYSGFGVNSMKNNLRKIMLAYRDLTKEQLEEELLKQKEAYKGICAKNISLDMSERKPGPDQLDLSMDMLDVFNSKSELKSENGFDCRNYGVMDGIPEAKKLMADIMEVLSLKTLLLWKCKFKYYVSTDFTFICRLTVHLGVNLKKVKWLCPVPGI